METAVQFAKAHGSKTPPAELPIAALVSAVAVAAAGGLLGYSLLPAKKRPTISSQLGFGVLAVCAAAVLWIERREEAAAAHHLVKHVHEVRDAHWLKRHPINFG
jgi:hypothetical protein